MINSKLYFENTGIFSDLTRARSLPKPVQVTSKSQKRKNKCKNRRKTVNTSKSGSGNFQTGSMNLQSGSNDPHETALIPTTHPGPVFGPTYVPNPDFRFNFRLPDPSLYSKNQPQVQPHFGVPGGFQRPNFNAGPGLLGPTPAQWFPPYPQYYYHPHHNWQPQCPFWENPQFPQSQTWYRYGYPPHPFPQIHPGEKSGKKKCKKK